MTRVSRRLNNELGVGNYEVCEYDKADAPLVIIYQYRNINIRVHLGNAYPFHMPNYIGNWIHSKYERLPEYYSYYTGKKHCQYCEIMDSWSPGTRLNYMVERFIKLDTSIANCVKVNMLFRNVLCLPEDLIPLILSYLEGVDGLSLPFRACIV